MSKPIETDFFIPLLPVSVIQLSGAGEVLRSMLEAMRCVVALHRPGTPGDFLKLVSPDYVPRYIVICGHGTEDGLHFGQYISEIDTSMLRNECLPAEAIRDNARLSGATVVSATCYGGTRTMADAFLTAGTKAYIASEGEPDGMAMNVFLINFFFALLSKGVSDEEAWRKAVQATNHEDIWEVNYFHADGVERLPQTPQ